MLGLGRSLAVERDRGTLEGLMLCPAPGGTIYLGKLLSNLLFIRLVEVESLAGLRGALRLAALAPSMLPIGSPAHSDSRRWARCSRRWPPAVARAKFSCRCCFFRSPFPL